MFITSYIYLPLGFTLSHYKVSLSSLNRHAVATRKDVGTPKALCLKKHFSSIYPECHIDAKVLLYDASSEEEILSGDPDFVLDCIDNIDTKVHQVFLLQKVKTYMYLIHMHHNTYIYTQLL